MWGDRLFDAREHNWGEWEAAKNGTAPAVDLIPKDIIVCPWHYERKEAYPSIPLFLNPPLRGLVPIFSAGRASGADAPSEPAEHVHRVLTSDGPAAPFHFGEAEWRRKGLNGWCATCSPPATTPL